MSAHHGGAGSEEVHREALLGSRAADAVAQVCDALREVLDVRRGQPTDRVEFDVFGRQLVEQSASLPEQDWYEV